ncbi:TonB-dependent receptor [Ekhidna sp. To15]|uniref:TonB-dependent receptor n=1 Tax=Ekhidna sp. To15 TaxID=3395267 RepID=UPI003F521633
MLLDFQNRYSVQFSYVDEVIEGKLVDYDTTLSLAEGIHKLEMDSRLRFEKIEDSYYVVRTYIPNDLISLCGYITDYNSNKLLGVSVSYGPTEGVISDEDGLFKLDSIPFDSWLTLRYLGYATKRLKVSRLPFNSYVDLRMTESIEELDEIVVTNYLATGISKNKNQIQIDPHKLKALSGLAEPDILQSIQQVPGVNSPFETAAGIHVRGGLPDQNLVLWNGIKTYSQGHFFGMISAFNPYIAEDVKFIKHGTPARYGDRISAVIDISSNDKVMDSFSGGIGTNLLFADGFVNVPLVKDKFSLQVSGRRSFTDVIQTPTYQQMSDRVFQNTKIGEALSDDQQSENDFYFSDLAINSVWEINKDNRLIFNGLYNSNQLNFSSTNQAINQTFNDQLLHENEGFNLQWKSRPNTKWMFDASSSFSRYILRYDFIETVPDTITQSSKKNFVQEGTHQLNTAYILNSKSELRGGYHLTNTRIRYAYETQSPTYQIVLDSDDSEVTTHAGYLDYLYDNGKLHIEPGVRFSYYHQLNDHYVEPRLYVQYRLSQHVTTSLSGEYRTQIASQIKESVVSDLSLENKVWAIASSERFPVLTSYQLTVGSDYEKNGWFAETELYYKRLDGVSTLIFGYLNGIENEFRVGESSIHGADILVKKIVPQFETWLSYSYLKTDNSFQGINNNESFPGSWSIEHTIRWSNIIHLNDWELSLGWLWHSGKSYTEVSQSADISGSVRIMYDAINANSLPDYHRMDFSAMREFHSNKHSNIRYRVGISVLNLYNKRNLLNREFRTTPSLENELIDTRVYSLGITPNLVFRVFW